MTINAMSEESMSGYLATTSKHMAGPMGLAVALLWLLVGPAAAQLRVREGKICGETKCEARSYCRERDLHCSPCSEICDLKKAHFDETSCDKLCQDYLHDIRYSRIESHSISADSNDLENQIKSLRVLATTSIVISVILAVIILGIFLIWAKKKNILNLSFKKQIKAEKGRYPGDTPISTIRLPKSTTVSIPAISEAVRNNNPGPPPTDYCTNLTTFKMPETDKPHPLKTKAPLERRVPSEDSALDFAYDNPALSPSPVPSKAESP